MPYYDNPPYYLTAYGIAVKHGFRGSEEEWLESLRGPKGDPVLWKAQYESEEALRRARPSGKAGDCCLVGTHLYWWDIPSGDWQDAGSWQGPEGLQGPRGEPGKQGEQGPPGPQGTQGDRGEPGPRGCRGPAGPEGQSAYQVAVDNGFEGSEADWLASLRGPEGEPGKAGDAGPDGRSAYQTAVDNGFVGSEAEWLVSLRGESGPAGKDGKAFTIKGYYPSMNALEDAVPAPKEGDSYGVGQEKPYAIYTWDAVHLQWVDNGAIQGPQGPAGAEGPAGPDGRSAYQTAVDNGFVGSEAEWLASLRGESGPAGKDGKAFTIKGYYPSMNALEDAVPAPKEGDSYGVGQEKPYAIYTWDAVHLQWVDNGTIQGSQGPAGTEGPAGPDGRSAYQTAVDNGFRGSEAEWLASLKGPKGDAGETGPQGPAGPAGRSAYQAAVENGFEGSEAEWLASLKGDTGEAGPAGTEGAPGRDGAQGPVGPTGPQGPDGIQGDRGPAGPGLPAGGTAGQVPVKAGEEDYQTAWQDPVGRSMAGQTVEPVHETTVEASEGAEVFNDYRDRTFGTDEGETLVHATEGNVASGEYSHAEGRATTASGQYSHVEGECGIASGRASHVEGGYILGRSVSNASGYGAHAEGVSTEASGQGSHSEGTRAKAYGLSAHAEGSSTTASGNYSHAEGFSTTASGIYSHAEGFGTTASENYSHAEGDSTTASKDYSHAEGYRTVASGSASHAEGNITTASAPFSHAGGEHTIANGYAQTAIGRYNVKQDSAYYSNSDKLLIGKGTSDNARANCFRVTDTGVYATGAHNSSGADYAELFEWADGNPDKEDRAGRFVTLDGEKIRLAEPGEDYVLGIVSGNPSVVGDVHDDQWAGMYLYDIFGRPLWEDVEVPAVTTEMPDPEDPERTVPMVVVPAHTERRQKLNPDYDSEMPYLPRTQRPEWDAVGLLGKLVAVDDGSCQVNGWCTAGEGGVAVHSEARTRFRVMARLDENHVRLMVLQTA